MWLLIQRAFAGLGRKLRIRRERRLPDAQAPTPQRRVP
jgi:hypothetical protein